MASTVEKIEIHDDVSTSKASEQTATRESESTSDNGKQF